MNGQMHSSPHLCACTYVHMYVCMYIYIYIYITYTYIYIYIYIYMHIFTYTTCLLHTKTTLKWYTCTWYACSLVCLATFWKIQPYSRATPDQYLTFFIFGPWAGPPATRSTLGITNQLTNENKGAISILHKEAETSRKMVSCLYLPFDFE
jgi:hypothetical protein